MIQLPSIQYTPPGGSLTSFNFKRGPQNFMPVGAARRNDNLATSGLRESIYEATDILISFTMPALLIGDDFATWDAFYAAMLQGGSFSFAPNPAITVAVAPWNGGTWVFNCQIEDTDFKPKRVAVGRYQLDSKFRVIPDGYAPPSAGAIMNAFMGYQPF